MDAPEASTSTSTDLRITIGEIRITGLHRRSLSRAPDAFVIVTVNGDPIVRTKVLKKSENPLWTDVATFSVKSLSEPLLVEVFHEKNFIQRVLLGRFISKVEDVVNGTPYELKSKDGSTSGMLTLQMTIPAIPQSQPTPNSPSPADSTPQIENAEAAVSNAQPAIDNLDDSATTTAFGMLQTSVPVTSSLEAGVQSTYTNASALSSSLAPLRDTISSLSQLMKVLDGFAEVHPICNAAWKALTAVYKALEKQTQQDNNIRDLSVSMRDMFAFARGVKNLRQLDGGIDVIKEMCLAVQDAASLIQQYMESGFLVRAAKGAVWDTMSTRIQNCKNRATYLNEQFDRLVGVQTLLSVGQMQEEAARKRRLDLLDRLPIVEQSGYDWLRTRCLDGTRQELLKDIFDWTLATKPDQPRIFWLHGWAGSGKSTVAATIAETLDERKWLAGSFFFNRSIADRSSPVHVFTTLATQLATRVPRISQAICEGIQNFPDIGNSAVITQWTKLISAPLQSSGTLNIPNVVVLDALDECASPTDLLTAIQRDISKLPSVIKFIITSRPESEVQFSFRQMGSLVRGHDLTGAETVNIERDIRAFISDRMSEVARWFDLEDGWPGDAQREALVRKAAGSFIWVSTATKFIREGGAYGPQAQLDLVLDTQPNSDKQSSPWADLDTLYIQVLIRAYQTPTANARIDMLQVLLGTIILAKNPLSASALASLVDLQHQHGMSGAKIARLNLVHLQSVLYVPTNLNEALRVSHPSFIDFLTDKARCIDSRFFVDQPTHRRHLAMRCFRLLHRCLKRDICDVGYRMLNSELPELAERISRCIPDALQYACQFWADHLSSIPCDDEICVLLEAFYKEDLLQWLEAMSLLGKIKSAFLALRTAVEWLEVNDNTQSLLYALARDSQRFLNDFRVPIEESANHVYHSAVPWTPTSSPLYTTYVPRLGYPLQVVMGAPLTWSPCLAVLEGHRGPVNCAAFSPDGLIVVSGSSDRHLILWDTRTGAPIGNILPEGGSSVCCLAFSPDGKRIAWATDDGTLCQFDPVTLAVIGPPMTVTLGKATGLLFSPDSTRIITYIEWSTDSPLCWDAVSGTVIGNLLKDPCEESVGTMRFSPDGKLLVTGSQASAKILLWDAIEGTLLRTIGDLKYGNDYTSTLLGFSEDCKNILQYSYQTGTLRLWDAETGSSKGKWLLGDDSHTAIAFSLAGDRAATSVDGRTQLWDATSADAIGEPLSGHTSKINSIHFSPTGKQFVSCSKDGTLRLWEATLVPGARRSDPDMGEISVIIVSPNRERVIAGSYGKILRLWDTRSGNPVGIDLKAPWPGFVTSAAFSPDSSRIALGCSINVVRLWDAVLGQPIGDPLRLGDGSTNEVDAVTFSTSGRLLATAPTYGRIKIWDLESRLQTGATMDGGLGSVDFLCFSADETQLISRGAPSTWRLWDLATTTLAKELSGRSGYGSSGRFRHEYDLSSCEFSPDGKKIIGTLKTSQFLYWDRHTGALTEPSEESRRADKPKDVYRSNGSGWIRDTSGRILFWVPAENRGQMFRVDLEYGLIVTTGYGGQLTVMRFQPSTRPRGDVEPAVS